MRGETAKSGTHGLRSEILRDWREVDRLGAEWNALLSSSRADILFLRREWIDAWRAVQADRLAPFVVVARDEEGRLAGLAPYYRTAYRFVGLVPYRALRVLADYPTGAECLDWILRSDREAEAAGAIAASLAAAKGEWDFLWMPYVPEWTGAQRRIAESTAAVGFLNADRDVAFGYLELPPDPDALMTLLPPRQRTATRSLHRKVFQERGGRFVRCESAEQIDSFLDGLFRLHNKRWSRDGEAGTFHRKPNEARFYRAFAPEAHRMGWLRLYGVELDGELRAVQIGYVYKGVFLSIQEGFDPESVPGIGNILRFRAMEDLIREGVRGYDFLGEMSEHKRRWRVVERKGRHMMIGTPGFRCRLLFANKVWPTGRYLRHVDLNTLKGR